MALFETISDTKKKDIQEIKLKNLIKIYEKKDFSKINELDFPTKNNYYTNTQNRRFLPKVILRFGKYSEKTLYEVYIEDNFYFNWLFEDKVLVFNDKLHNLVGVRYSGKSQF